MSEAKSSQPDPAPEQPKPFVAPCHDRPPSATLQWLRDGWRDYRAAPGLSIAWGTFCMLLSWSVAWMAWRVGGWVLLLSLLSGFVFVAPLLAFGMYSISRKLCMGRTPTFAGTLRAVRRPIANSLVFALVLLVIFLIWARAASMVHIFFPSTGTLHLREMAVYLGVGSAVGACFAYACFAASVFSLPFIANRDVDVITAVVSSVNAVLRNRWTMFAWAVIVATLTGVGFMTGMIGFIVIMPWLGYATWHGYRDSLDVDGWDVLPAHHD
ncbi:MAG: DUF2189 domain-containing protein [Xanthomonadales bacterium]